MENRIKKVLVIGSGGIRIGQSAEFDYSGSQALKALAEEGIETVLVNPNIATIQTSKRMASRVYLEPLTPEFLVQIIEREKPDGVLLGFGGQTALNLGVRLAEMGILEKYGVKVLGTEVEAIKITEDRELFCRTITSLGIAVPESMAASSVKEAVAFAKQAGYPVILRPAYTLGGLGSKIVREEESLGHSIEIAKGHSMIGQVIVEKYLEHWKEVEYEVVRDMFGNCITVCNMENIDPMGIHTGDSMVVAPSQTLTNKEYHTLRKAAIDIISHLRIVGECNIQFALDPHSSRFYVIEVNARLSRSSALASKATGYPLAYIAAKLSVGCSLPEIKNKVTSVTVADFEPSLDYLVVKIPRFEFQKFRVENRELDSQMRSIGEVMAIGRNFEETVQKAVRCLELGHELPDNFLGISKEESIEAIKTPNDQRLFQIMHALRLGTAPVEIAKATGITEFFVRKLANVAEFEKVMGKAKITDTDFRQRLAEAKRLGFSDRAIAGLLGISAEKVRSLRAFHGIRPFFKQIDTMAAEWPAKTNYMYATYTGSADDGGFGDGGKMLIIGAGPIRIGSSVEFDWCTMSCVEACMEEGYKTIVLNCNPETVSTDFDCSDRLYFDEITLERVLDIIEKEKPVGVVVSVGGQTSNNIAYSLAKRNVPIVGTSGRQIDMAENREKFSGLLDSLGISQPVWKSLASLEDMKAFAEKIGYPVIVRPSYVLSGASMKVAANREEMLDYVRHAAKVSRDYPVVVSKFMEDAKEIEVDGVSDGEQVLIGAVVEHIEKAGVHSGDASMVIPPQTISARSLDMIADYTERIAKAMKIRGPFNIQFLEYGGSIMVIECNLRASRSMPFVSKAVNRNLVSLATKCMLGKKLESSGILSDGIGKMAAVKFPMFSWSRMRGVYPSLSVEMSSTGEVACFGRSFEEAFLKAFIATETPVPFRGKIMAPDLNPAMENRLRKLGFDFSGGDATMLIDTNGSDSRRVMAEKGATIIMSPETLEVFVSCLEKKPELRAAEMGEYYAG